MESGFSNKTLTEPAREIKITGGADIVVVGGGSRGTATALLVKEKIQPRNVDYNELESNLVSQGVNIPQLFIIL